MREDTRKKLEAPYPSNVPEELCFEVAIEMGLNSVHALAGEVFADLDETVHGVGWWAPHCAEPGRIRNSDHLWKCIRSVAWNLVEARLHAHEAHSGFDAERGFVNVVRTPTGHYEAALRERRNALEELPVRHTGMHIASFFVTLGSALDCLAGSIAGVTALGNVFKTDLRRVREALNRVNVQTGPGEAMKAGFRDDFEKLVTGSGPEDWHEWVRQSRNMVVHRARRQIHAVSTKREPKLYGWDGRELVRADLTTILTAQPGLSEMEVFLDTSPQVLSEPAEVTIEGAFTSALKLAEGTCTLLLDFWKRRRANPSVLPQPDDWPSTPERVTRFKGYTPGSLAVDLDLRQVPPDLQRRIRAAGLSHRLFPSGLP